MGNPGGLGHLYDSGCPICTDRPHALVPALIAEVERLQKETDVLFAQDAPTRRALAAEAERDALQARLKEWEGYRSFLEVHGLTAPAGEGE
jgi:hypothetical protein